MLLKWTKKLSSLPLCVSPEVCADDYMVNAAAISDNGSRVVAGDVLPELREYVAAKTGRPLRRLRFLTAGSGTLLFSHEYDGEKGIYAVAMSGDGTVAAGGGLLTMGRVSPFKPKRGLLLAFDVATGTKLLETSDITDRVTSVGLSRNGQVLVAVADKSLFVFLRGSSGSFSNPPHVVTLVGYCETVAVHPSGTWLAAPTSRVSCT